MLVLVFLCLVLCSPYFFLFLCSAFLDFSYSHLLLSSQFLFSITFCNIPHFLPLWSFLFPFYLIPICFPYPLARCSPPLSLWGVSNSYPSHTDQHPSMFLSLGHLCQTSQGRQSPPKGLLQGVFFPRSKQGSGIKWVALYTQSTWEGGYTVSACVSPLAQAMTVFVRYHNSSLFFHQGTRYLSWKWSEDEKEKTTTWWETVCWLW